MALLRRIKPNLAWFKYCIVLSWYYTKGGNYTSFKPSSKIERVVEGAQIQNLSHYSGVLVGMGAWVSNLEIAQILHPKI